MYFVGKRLFDLSFALASLVLAWPVFMIIALGIKLTSRGPVFFRQQRVGMDEKPIIVLKFRTMTLDATEQSLVGAVSLVADPRITPFGRFLRMTALDELPLIVNVFKGDLSLVGPRPAMPYEVRHYTRDQWERLRCKPGITGYWQVYGRREGALDLNQMVKMDLEYAQKRSFMLDLRILGRSFMMVFTGRYAY